MPELVVCDSEEAVPASPTAPTATNNKTGINLAWTDASSDETGFKVYRKLSTETEAKVIATQTAVTYSDTDLADGQTAYYHVIAYNDNGESAKSKTVSGTADFTPPTVLSVTPAAGSSDSSFMTISVSFVFSESMLLKSGSATDVPLLTYKINGVAYNADINVMILYSNTVSGILINHQASSSYELTIRKEDITDSSGLPMDSDYIWSFTTP